MALACNVCEAALEEPLFVSQREQGITSLCQVLPRHTEVWLCEACGHLMTPPLPNVDAYYDDQYRILIESEEEDQIYSTQASGTVFRADHQLQTLIAKVPLPQGAEVLDYGCAKGATLRGLARLRPDVRPHLFDVSEMYLPFWRKFADPSCWATHKTPAAWKSKFDLVTSFYSLEHIPEPRATLKTIAGLLRPGGVLYAIVPDVYQNVGDFVVSDHVNHFSVDSFRHAIEEAGFLLREIDAQSHANALIALAERQEGAPVTTQPPDPDRVRAARSMAGYWTDLEERVRAFEDEHRGRRAAVYGSGFYGTWIASCLRDAESVGVFLDQNPHRQGCQLLGVDIKAPEALPSDVEVLYVGLNPRIARAEIAKVKTLASRQLEVFFP